MGARFVGRGRGSAAPIRNSCGCGVRAVGGARQWSGVGGLGQERLFRLPKHAGIVG